MAKVQERLHAPATPRPGEHTFTLRDGTELFYRAWLPRRSAIKALVLFHRGHEHSGRWQETVAALGLDDVAVFAWDQRGHGWSPGERGWAPDLATVVGDADEWVRHVLTTHGIPAQDTVVLAHSLGAVIATAWVHDHAPPIRGLILATPAFRVKLYLPLAVPLLRLRQRLLGPGYVKSYVRPGMLTHDPAQAQGYNADPLIFRQIAVNMLLDLHDTSKRLLDDAAAVTVPLLVLAAGSDWVVQTSAQRRFVERASSAVKRFEILPGFSHAIFHERDRRLVVLKVRDFIDECFARPPAPPPLDADRRGPTRDEYDRLCAPGGLRFVPVRWLMKGPGRVSRGINLGWKHGFDSGVMLDYVYENRAQGLTLLGRIIDRFYLNAIGWRGIRVRRTLLEQALRSAIEAADAEGRQVRLLDVACGAGRYLLETIRRLNNTIPVSAVLRDCKPESLDAAARLRDELGVTDITLTAGDAFDRDSLAALTPRPSIAVVSGLYELFPDNAPVLRSLQGLADAVEPGGRLLYTNQPWHPQLEFIARVLPNREGRPWTMRCRTQAEMDALVRAAGFEKVSQETDPWGLFTVSVARRVGP
jgi:alpha-beta hydrolase superfamily lysophospholipase/SAM-dependent methyltransferase